MPSMARRHLQCEAFEGIPKRKDPGVWGALRGTFGLMRGWGTGGQANELCCLFFAGIGSLPMNPI